MLSPNVVARAVSSPALAALILTLIPLLFSTAAHAQWVWVGSDQYLRINGGKFFPVGLVELGIDRYPDDWNDRIRESGANLVWDNGFAYADSFPSCEAIEDSSVSAGYYVLTGSPDTWEWDDLGTPELEVDQPMFDAAPLDDLDNCFGGFTTHIGYSNRDEPIWTISRNQIGDIDVQHVIDTYDQLKGQDPFKVVGMNFASVNLSQSLETWTTDVLSVSGATDIVMSASYPYPPGTCSQYNVFDYPACSMDRLWITADHFTSQVVNADQSFWMVLQGFKNIPLPEARWQATMAIIHGARGLLWAGWAWVHPLGNGSTTWPVTKQVVQEFVALHDVLIDSDLTGYSSLEPNVDVLAKNDPDGDAYVFAASKNDFQGAATIQLPANLAGDWVEVVNEERYLPIQGDTITDSFAGLVSSHIYRVMPAGFVPTSVTPAARPAEDGFRLRVFPNPAFRTVTASFTAAGERGVTEISVYDVTGRRLGEAEVRSTGVGTGVVEWEAVDASGRPLAPGVYFLRGVTGSGEATSARVVLR